MLSFCLNGLTDTFCRYCFISFFQLSTTLPLWLRKEEESHGCSQQQFESYQFLLLNCMFRIKTTSPALSWYFVYVLLQVSWEGLMNGFQKIRRQQVPFKKNKQKKTQSFLPCYWKVSEITGLKKAHWRSLMPRMKLKQDCSCLSIFLFFH